MVVDDGVAGPVEAGGEGGLGDRHPDAVGKTLSERTGRDLHPRRVSAFRVTRRPGTELAEALDLAERQVVAGEVEQAVEEHRTVTAGEDEPVAIRPAGVARVV